MGTRTFRQQVERGLAAENLERTTIDFRGIAQPGHRAIRRSFAPAGPSGWLACG